MSQSLFKNPYIVSQPVLLPGAVGNGTLTINKLTHFSVSQTYTVVCTAVAPFTVFKVVGSLDGAVGVAQIGQEFYDSDLKLFFTIEQGPILFALGDTFEFEVAQGTDLTQENLDSYDHLPQKNFSAGVTGTNSGDDNIRLENLQKVAQARIQSLIFTALDTTPEGNGVSVEYVAGTFLEPAELTLENITYTAQVPGPGGNDITVQYLDWVPGVKASLTVAEILYEMLETGVAGNAYTVEYVDDAVPSPVVELTGTALKVTFQSGVHTCLEVRTAVNAHPGVAAVMYAYGVGPGEAAQFAPYGPNNLTGGVDDIGKAGNEVVQCVGNQILVQFQSGVSTALQIKTKVDANVDAAALVSTSLGTGTEGNPQTAPVAATHLSGGTNAYGEPGSEVVEVVGKSIKVTFQNGMSTAQQIHNAILAVPAAAALVSIAYVGLVTVLQTSPVARTFLSGSISEKTYVHNQKEISDPTNFYRGNASIAAKDAVINGKAYVRDNTTLQRKLALDDLDAAANSSGDRIDNAQKNLNILAQFFSRLQIQPTNPASTRVIITGADVSMLDGRTLGQEVSKRLLAFEGAQIDFATGLVYEADGVTPFPLPFTPITMPNGNFGWYAVGISGNTVLPDETITAQVLVTPALSSAITKEAAPRGRFTGTKKIGQVCIQKTLTSIAPITESSIIQLGIGSGGGDGGGVGFQEVPIGTINGTNDTFAISKLPTDHNSMIVFVNGLPQPLAAYEIVDQSIIFQPAYIPQLGDDLYVFYLTEGVSLTVAAPTGTENVEYRTVTTIEASLKQMVLSATPAVPSKVKVDVISGGAQVFGEDFSIVANVLEWAGLGLDALPLEAGDKLRVIYQS